MKRRYEATTSRAAKKSKAQIIPRISPTPELKRNYQSPTTLGMGSIANAWVEYDSMGAITTGVGLNARVGRKVAVNSIKFKGVFGGGAIGSLGADDYYNVLRLCIWIGNNPNIGVAVTPLQSSSILLSMPINRDNVRGMGKVLYDKYHAFTNQPYGANICAPATKEITFFHRFKKPLVIQYTADSAYYNQRQIWLAAITDSTAVPNPGMIAGYWEMTWYDF